MSESLLVPTRPARRAVCAARFRLRPEAKPIEDGAWFWPLPRLVGQAPRVITHVNDERCGVHLGYDRLTFTNLFVPVYAAQGGTVSFATHTSSGFAVTIDHGGRWSTHYAHLLDMFVVATEGRRRRRARVRAGDVIGYAARSPIHIRFELWKWSDDGFVPDIAALRMRDWQLWPQETRRADHAAA
jgi:murein DD-endopeptidase MepM/ murein hydrolase activator NlpD